MNAVPSPFPRPRDWLFLAGGLCLLFGWFLGGRGLNEPDEGRYANIAMAMAKPGGDWWEPRMSGYGHYDKPPGIYWATAASFRTFGLNDWAARVPSLAGALLALGGLGWTAFRLYGARTAWWAVLIAGTSVQLWTFGRILSPDMLLTGWCTVAVAAWAEGKRSQNAECRMQKSAGGRRNAEGGTRNTGDSQAKYNFAAEEHSQVQLGNEGKAEGRGIHHRDTEDTEKREGWSGWVWGWWGAALCCWTLAWWTKATPALIPLLGLIVGIFATGDAAGRRALKPWWLVPAILVLGSPWYLSMLARYPELNSFFFGRELAGRLAGRVDGRHGSVCYYLPVSLLAWLPWWPVAAWRVWRQRTALFAGPWREVAWRWTRRLGVDGWIVVVGMVVLSLAGSKLPSYTLTLAPWAALLMARALTTGAEAADVTPTWQRLVPAGLLAAVAMTGSVVLPDLCESKLGVNSSLRQAGLFLRARGATRVDADHYWPGLEFYLGEGTVRYLVNGEDTTRAKSDEPMSESLRIERHQERASDNGVLPERFVDSRYWPEVPAAERNLTGARPGSWWFVRFRRRGKPRFEALLGAVDPKQRPVKVARFGEFDLYQMPDGL